MKEARSEGAADRRVVADDGRQMPVRIMIIVRGQTELLEVVVTLDARRGLAHLLHTWEQQAEQDHDDANHHEQFHQREPEAWSRLAKLGHGYRPFGCVQFPLGAVSNFDTSQTLTV